MTDFTDNWDIPHTTDIFPTRGFGPDQWNASANEQINLTEYLNVRLSRNPDEVIQSVLDKPLTSMEVARQFSKDRRHILDLQNLRFYFPNSSFGKVLLTRLHS